MNINKHTYIIISNAFNSRISSSSSREKLSSKLLPPTIELEAVEVDVEVAVDLAFVTCWAVVLLLLMEFFVLSLDQYYYLLN